jgi:hypothetical protein
MNNLFPHLLQRSFATTCLDIVKMKAFVPCQVEDEFTAYQTTMVEIVFDPLRIEEVNARFKAAGYEVDEGMQVIAVNEDGSILLWGGLNSVFHLRPGEHIEDAFDEQHLAFEDLLDLTKRFNIKNKKGEIDELIAQLKTTYSQEPRHQEKPQPE